MFRISNVLISSGAQNTSESTLNLKRINILVGPNNSGKSTLLKDIESWFNQESSQMRLLKNVTISISDRLVDYQEFERDILEFEDGERIKRGRMVFIPVVKQHLLTEFREGPEWYSLDSIRTEFSRSNIKFFRQHFFRFFVARLDARNRFQLIDPKHFHIWRSNKTPFNYLSRLYLSAEDQNKLGEIVNKEFSHYTYLKKTDSVIDIMLSDVLRVEIGNSTLENQASLPNDALRVSEFGDGVQCFIAICLSILSCPFRVVLIDEPEAYLHPPTAYSLGKHLSKWVKEKHRSLVVATHSSEFLMGCLHSLPSSDISVTRLTYQDRIGKVKQLDDNEISNFRDDPLLRSSDVINAFFYSSAIVGEGYEDKAIYQETNSKLLQYERGINNTVFLNANGKEVVHKITRPLRKIGIPAAAIYDFDVMRISKESKKLWKLILSSTDMEDTMISYFEQQRDFIGKELEILNRKRAKGDQDYYENLSAERMSPQLNRRISEFLNEIKKYGIFIVPRGKLEQWLREVPYEGQDKDFVKLLKKIYMTEPTKNDIWQFVDEINIWTSDPNRKGMLR